jgi:predicted GIY-YIG superfamily endonuclease
MTVDLTGLPAEPDGRWYLYAHLGAADQILYVGLTSSPLARQGQHRRRASWWPEVARVEVLADYADKRLALDAETLVIETAQPANNLLRTERERAHYDDVSRRRFRSAGAA